MSKTEILVVGAGLVGLATADILRQAGRDTTILEARDRVGGRVWSVPGGAGLRSTWMVKGSARGTGALAPWSSGYSYL